MIQTTFGFEFDEKAISVRAINEIIATCREQYLNARLYIVAQEARLSTTTEVNTLQRYKETYDSFVLVAEDLIKKLNMFEDLKMHAYDFKHGDQYIFTGDDNIITIENAAKSLVRAQASYLNAISFLNSFPVLISRNDESVEAEQKNIQSLRAQYDTQTRVKAENEAEIAFLRTFVTDDLEIEVIE